VRVVSSLSLSLHLSGLGGARIRRRRTSDDDHEAEIEVGRCGEGKAPPATKPRPRKIITSGVFVFSALSTSTFGSSRSRLSGVCRAIARSSFSTGSEWRRQFLGPCGDFGMPLPRRGHVRIDPAGGVGHPSSVGRPSRMLQGYTNLSAGGRQGRPALVRLLRGPGWRRGLAARSQRCPPRLPTSGGNRAEPRDAARWAVLRAHW
jgi:hypothetical protein